MHPAGAQIGRVVHVTIILVDLMTALVTAAIWSAGAAIARRVEAEHRLLGREQFDHWIESFRSLRCRKSAGGKSCDSNRDYTSTHVHLPGQL